MRISPILLKTSSSSSRWISRQTRDPYVKSRSNTSSSTNKGNSPNYRSRSSFKLISLANKHPLFSSPSSSSSPSNSSSSSNDKTKIIVDLGAAPGGWSQVISHLTKGKGKTKIFALDILDIEPIPNVNFLKGDFLSEEIRNQFRLQTIQGPGVGLGQGEGEREGVREEQRQGIVDCVLSDMMAPMTGNRTRNVSLSLELCAAATVFARDVLRKARPDEEIRKEGNKKIYPGGNLVIKFFAHPDMDEFRSIELDPWFGKVVVEKPKESRAESSEAYWVCLGFKGDPALR